MRIRYTGTDDSRDLAVDGGLIPCERLKWVDVVAFAEEHQLDVDAVTDAAKRAVKSDVWELESAKKAARARKAAKKSAGPLAERLEELVASDAQDAVDHLKVVGEVAEQAQQNDEQEES